MALKIAISNRQRTLPVNLEKLEKMTARLAGETIHNLIEQPARHLSRRKLRDIEDKGAISLILVSNRKIKQINSEWRQKDYATDVLSFPLIFDGPQSVSGPIFDALELGEIIISLEKCRDQAREYNHSFDRELAFLFVHGTLHILGFDHITKRQEQDMFGRQREILAEAGFRR